MDKRVQPLNGAVVSHCGKVLRGCATYRDVNLGVALIVPRALLRSFSETRLLLNGNSTSSRYETRGMLASLQTELAMSISFGLVLQ
jgi:hypothetical protein